VERLLAMAAGIWHNWTTGLTSKRSLIAFDHQHQLHGINHRSRAAQDRAMSEDGSALL
jgi:hypothetical protein